MSGQTILPKTPHTHTNTYMSRLCTSIDALIVWSCMCHVLATRKVSLAVPDQLFCGLDCQHMPSLCVTDHPSSGTAYRNNAPWLHPCFRVLAGAVPQLRRERERERWATYLVVVNNAALGKLIGLRWRIEIRDGGPGILIGLCWWSLIYLQGGLNRSGGFKGVCKGQSWHIIQH